MALKRQPGTFYRLVKETKNYKYYETNICPRCSGTGWWAWDRICFKCGGSGIFERKTLIKEPATEEKKQELAAKSLVKAEEKCRIRAEQKRQKAKEFGERFKGWYFSEDGKAWRVLGNTYSIKDKIKEAGGRWLHDYRSWVFKNKPEEFETQEINFSDLYGINGWNEFSPLHPCNYFD